jgi:hypothetical protein
MSCSALRRPKQPADSALVSLGKWPIKGYDDDVVSAGLRPTFSVKRTLRHTFHRSVLERLLYHGWRVHTEQLR